MAELKILDEKENALFSRKEITGTIDSDITPNREDILKLLSEKFSIPKENIKIKGIFGSFGSKTFEIQAHIYSSEEEKNAVEIKKKKEQPKKTEEQPEPAPEATTTQPATPKPVSDKNPKEEVNDKSQENPELTGEAKPKEE